MSTSTAPRTVRATCSHSSSRASAGPEAAAESFSVDARGRSTRPGSIAPSSPRHAAASRCVRSETAVRFSETQHRRSAAMHRPTTSALVSRSRAFREEPSPETPGTSHVPAARAETRWVDPDPVRDSPFESSSETAAGSARSARRSSPSAVARTACDSSSRPSVSARRSEASGISPRSARTAALAHASRSHSGSVGRRARMPVMMGLPERNTSSSITAAAAAAFAAAAAGAAGSSSASPRGFALFEAARVCS